MIRLYKTCIKTFSTSSIFRNPHICIVGSGPAGFYTAQQILKSHETAKVDIYEKLPVPFGLVRYGVAPDHPEVKNCINTFTQAAQSERVSFLGNISIGQDVTLDQLKNAYHAVVLAYGAAKDKMLNVPGEDLPNVVPARRLVGWYNGLPEDSSLQIDFNVEDVAIIGQGNVAIDVARILLTSVDILKKTDIPEPVLEKLSQSRIKRVHMIGRRRPQDVAFTIKELREMINLNDCRPVFLEEDFTPLSSVIADSPRPRKRLLELLRKTSLEPTEDQLQSWKNCDRQWKLWFLRSPVEILASNDGLGVQGIKLAKNRMEGTQAVPSNETEILECGLVLRSIGYTSFKIDPSIPFDDRKGIIPNDGGKVDGHEGLYVSGWVGTGAVGVLLNTMQSGFQTGKKIISHMKSGQIDTSKDKEGKQKVLQILADKNVNVINFDDWNHLDSHEVTVGTKIGKPREKITNVSKMLEIVQKKES